MLLFSLTCLQKNENNGQNQTFFLPATSGYTDPEIRAGNQSGSGRFVILKIHHRTCLIPTSDVLHICGWINHQTALILWINRSLEMLKRSLWSVTRSRARPSDRFGRAKEHHWLTASWSWLLHVYYWSVVWNMTFIFHFIYGMSAFPLTYIFFKMVKTNNQIRFVPRKVHSCNIVVYLHTFSIWGSCV